MGGEQRSIPRALLMGIIPFLHLYLFYQWCNEAKLHWKVAWLNATLYTVIFLVPLLNIYPLFKLLTVIDDKLKAEGKKGYPVPVWLLAILGIPPIPFWLITIYLTQKLFNDNKVSSL